MTSIKHSSVCLACRQRPGFLLLEALIGFTLFALFLGAVGLTLLVSQQGTATAADRARAIALTQRALEATRSLRNADWASLTDGTHGLSIQNGRWAFAGTGAVSAEGFVTAVDVTSPETDHKVISAKTTWSFGLGRSGSVLLTEELTNWRVTKDVGNWASPQLVGSIDLTGTPALYRVAVADSVAYVSTETGGGGPGLAMFDVSTPSSPVRIASDFVLDTSGYDIAISGTTLYIITADVSQELRIYDISDPASFSSAALLGTYDLPGDARARSLALRGTDLIVGVTESVSEDEVYVLDVTNPADPLLQGVVNVDGNVLALSVNGSAVYAASGEDVAELRVIDITDPSHPVSDTGSGYNLTDSVDGFAVAVTGTSAVIGRDNGSFIEELAFFDLETNLIPSPPPGPWFREVGTPVSHLQIDLTQQYAFSVQATGNHELSVLDLKAWSAGLSPLAAQVDLPTSEGRGLFYDAAADRLYVVTKTALYIYRPS